MPSDLPLFITVIFIIITIASLVMLHRVVKNSSSRRTREKSKTVFIASIVWLVLQATISIEEVYKLNTNSFPPKILIAGILPPFIFLFILFTSKTGKRFIDSLPLKKMTFLHIIRIPVEVILYFLSIYQYVPELMTFTGRNFDVLAGISAPIIVYYAWSKQSINRKGILIWNFICLGLLINIVINALLSAPSPIQEFAFNQPNIAILNFPFVWLPTFIVPVIFFCHLSSIRQLLVYKSEVLPKVKKQMKGMN